MVNTPLNSTSVLDGNSPPECNIQGGECAGTRFSETLMGQEASAYKVDPLRTAKLEVSVPARKLANPEGKLACDVIVPLDLEQSGAAVVDQ